MVPHSNLTALGLLAVRPLSTGSLCTFIDLVEAHPDDDLHAGLLALATKAATSPSSAAPPAPQGVLQLEALLLQRCGDPFTAKPVLRSAVCFSILVGRPVPLPPSPPPFLPPSRQSLLSLARLLTGQPRLCTGHQAAILCVSQVARLACTSRRRGHGGAGAGVEAWGWVQV